MPLLPIPLPLDKIWQSFCLSVPLLNRVATVRETRRFRAK